jgi:hypothetical protein
VTPHMEIAGKRIVFEASSGREEER